jgi:glycerol-3-phosphate acyltransferase PlsY
MLWWFLPPAAYLLGSVSFAYLAGRLNGIDLRQHGSGNLGATNAGRVLGFRWFLAVFICDLLKGLVPVALVMHLAPDPGAWLPLLTAAGALLGHVFTCFHGFKGGKAVATSLGVLIGLLWMVASITFVLWLVVWCTAKFVAGRSGSKSVGPASVVAAIAVPVIYTATFPHPWSGGNIAFGVFISLVSALVVWRHRSNIAEMLGRDVRPVQGP